MKDTTAVILAGGKGTRMQTTTTNKVVYPLAGKPMIAYALESLHQAGIDSIVVVVGYAKESVIQVIKNTPVLIAEQIHRLGTGHALKCGLSKVPQSSRTILSLYGDDSAFYEASLYQQLLASHHQTQAAVSLVTLHLNQPHGLGRILRSSTGTVCAIVEEKNATPKQRQITEINTGLYCFDRQFIDRAIKHIKKNPISGEYYLTDVVALANRQHLPINAIVWHDPQVWHGVNTQSEWHSAQIQMSRYRQKPPKF